MQTKNVSDNLVNRVERLAAKESGISSQQLVQNKVKL